MLPKFPKVTTISCTCSYTFIPETLTLVQLCYLIFILAPFIMCRIKKTYIPKDHLYFKRTYMFQIPHIFKISSPLQISIELRMLKDYHIQESHMLLVSVCFVKFLILPFVCRSFPCECEHFSNVLKLT